MGKAEKARREREMYFCKMAPHKSDMQPSREKAGRKRHVRKREGAREEMKKKMKWYVKEIDKVEEFLQEDSGLRWTSFHKPTHALSISCSTAHKERGSLRQHKDASVQLSVCNRWCAAES